MKFRDKIIFPKMEKSEENSLKERIFEIIFEADTRNGRLFDIILLITILLSVILVTLESVASVNARYHNLLVILEWTITILFTVEYAFRIYCVRRPWRYIFSFYGIIDFLSILPTYLAILYPTTKFLASIRILRLLRVFRIFKLSRLLQGQTTILISLKKNRSKFIVFLAFITVMVVFLGSLIYMMEGHNPDSPINNIPIGIYWAAVTLTTVGYGDITPVTVAGRVLATIVMILGYGIIVIQGWFIIADTVSDKMLGSTTPEKKDNTRVCQYCHDSNHEDGANFCKTCGYPLHH